LPSLATATKEVDGLRPATVPFPQARREAAGQRGSSEDDLPLWLNHAQDRGAGRGLNPTPDERRPAGLSMPDVSIIRQYDAQIGLQPDAKLERRDLLQLL
jgi:hypothetical protein